MATKEAVGIDLGTTYSCIDEWTNNGIENISNDQGETGAGADSQNRSRMQGCAWAAIGSVQGTDYFGVGAWNNHVKSLGRPRPRARGLDCDQTAIAKTAAFGSHLGNTYSRACVWSKEGVEIVANDQCGTGASAAAHGRRWAQSPLLSNASNCWCRRRKRTQRFAIYFRKELGPTKRNKTVAKAKQDDAAAS